MPWQFAIRSDSEPGGGQLAGMRGASTPSPRSASDTYTNNIEQSCFTKGRYRTELQGLYKSRSLSHALYEVRKHKAFHRSVLTTFLDESDESATWENEWLQNGWVDTIIPSHEINANSHRYPTSSNKKQLHFASNPARPKQASWLLSARSRIYLLSS